MSWGWVGNGGVAPWILELGMRLGGGQLSNPATMLEGSHNTHRMGWAGCAPEPVLMQWQRYHSYGLNSQGSTASSVRDIFLHHPCVITQSLMMKTMTLGKKAEFYFIMTQLITQ
jgi:hypothetical protein